MMVPYHIPLHYVRCRYCRGERSPVEGPVVVVEAKLGSSSIGSNWNGAAG